MAVKVWLQGQPDIVVTGSIREISPEADSATGTYTVKVALPSPPPEMRLGAAVVGRAEAEGQEVEPALRPRCCSRETGRRSGWWGRTAECAARRSGFRVRCRRRRHQPWPVGRREGRHRRRQLADRRPAGEARDGGRVMSRFNLSEWAVHNKAIVVFLMLLVPLPASAPMSGLAGRRTPTSRSRPWWFRSPGRAPPPLTRSIR